MHRLVSNKLIKKDQNLKQVLKYPKLYWTYKSDFQNQRSVLVHRILNTTDS